MWVRLLGASCALTLARYCTGCKVAEEERIKYYHAQNAEPKEYPEEGDLNYMAAVQELYDQGMFDDFYNFLCMLIIIKLLGKAWLGIYYNYYYTTGMTIQKEQN